MTKKDKNSAGETQTESDDTNELAKIKNRFLATGIEDYGFWWAQMLKEQSGKSVPDPSSFRRGRIWS
ncbi:MAG: cyanobactin biosynthesis PatC/TenC/TruC family protein [Oscillatoriaceae cyanobacterium Prado104]|jgi:cyanobactin cluster PatC/TenC/TruC protein|nr:cyanobactin biosynthesis PatC/TenC/TruC family protein [Oscillatoriaceae cyanobacterium Prado104]